MMIRTFSRETTSRSSGQTDPIAISRLLRETSRWVSTPTVAKLGKRRMTLTLPVLEAAQHILFLITGSEKAATLREVLLGNEQPPLPAQMVRPRDGALSARASTHRPRR